MVGAADEGQKCRRRIDLWNFSERRGRGRLDPGPVVFGCRPGERLERQIGHHRAVELHDEAVLGDCLADDGEIEVPFFEDGAGLGLLLRAQHHQHALLALGEHHFVGGHRLFADRDALEVEADAQTPLVAHLHRRAGQARRTHVLDRDHRAGGHQLEAGLHQPLLGEGIAHLHGRALFLDGVVELGRGHGRTAHPVAPGLGAEIDHRHADAGGGGIEDRVGLGETGGEGVHEAIAVIGGMEAQFAADGRHAEAIAVAADAGHHALDEAAGFRMVRAAEGERVHRGDGARAHGEDVAQDAADAGGGALVGLDIGGVVVALHLEDQRLAVADVDDAGVLAGAADHLGAGGGQGAQPFLRGLVGAMLVPHRREDAELGQGRRAADQVEDAVVFVGLQPVGGDHRGGDFGILHLPLRASCPF